MKFSEKLNDYIEQLSCTGKDICNLSGISAASFSRYRNGERVPELGTKPFEIYAVRCHRFPHKKESYKSPLTL